MARIIELCGSPGVGKSSIFFEIEKRRKRGDSWETASLNNPFGNEDFFDFAKRIYRKIKKGRRNIGRTTNKEGQLDFVKRVYRECKLGRNPLFLDKLKEAGERFIAQHPDYIEACWGNIFKRQANSFNGLDLRFEKSEFIYKIIKKVQVIREKKTEKLIIIDEGLINMIDRGLHNSENSIREMEEIHNLLEVMPLPDALVYIETDLKINADRLILRQEIRDMHKGLTVVELIESTRVCRERILTAITYLKNKDVPVLFVDASDPVKLNAEKIIEFTNGLKENGALVSSEKIVVF